MTESETFTLTRTGAAPLRFQGRLIAENDGERQAGSEHNRWHELAIYQTSGGRYVVRIAFCTRWEGELHHDIAEIVDAGKDTGGDHDHAETVAEILQSYDPMAHVGGYPSGTGYEDRQRRLDRDIRARYAAQVSEILAGGDFAEDADSPAPPSAVDEGEVF